MSSLPELDVAMLALLMTVTPNTFSSLTSSVGGRTPPNVVFLFTDFNRLTFNFNLETLSIVLVFFSIASQELNIYNNYKLIHFLLT